MIRKAIKEGEVAVEATPAQVGAADAAATTAVASFDDLKQKFDDLSAKPDATVDEWKTLAQNLMTFINQPQPSVVDASGEAKRRYVSVKNKARTLRAQVITKMNAAAAKAKAKK